MMKLMLPFFANKKKTFAIVGGCGLLGQHLVHFLLNEEDGSKKNLQLKVIDRIHLEKIKLIYPADFSHPQVSLFLGIDISDAAQLNNVLEGVDIVFHLAAAILYGKKNKILLQASNELGTQNILNESQKARVKKVIYVSSFATLGCLDDQSHYATEYCENNWDADTHFYYGYSKYKAELLALNAAHSAMSVVVAIPGVMFGPGPAHHASILPFLVALKKKWALAPEGGMGIVDVRDAARALILMAKNKKSAGKYLLVSHNITHKNLLKRIAMLGKNPLEILEIPKRFSPFLRMLGSILEWFLPKQSPYSEEGIAKAFQYRYFSHQKIKNELGWSPRYTLDETLRDTISYSGLQDKKNMQLEPVVVTGATGFLGQHLTRELIKRGYPVYIMTRNPRQASQIFKDKSINIIELSENALLENIPQNARIFHCAAITGSNKVSAQAYHEANANMTRNLLRGAIKNHAISFTFVSSISAVGAVGSLGQPITEKTIPFPKTYYGMSKLAAENSIFEIAASALPITIIRPPIIYGPGQTAFSGAGILFKLCGKTLVPVIGNAQSFLSLAYVGNVVSGLIELTLRNEGQEIFNLADLTPYSIQAIAQTLHAAKEKEKAIRFIEIPYPLMLGVASCSDVISWLTRKDMRLCSELVKGLAKNGLIMSIDKAMEYGYQPSIHLEEGVKTMLRGKDF